MDTTAKISRKEKDGNSLRLRFVPEDPSLLLYIIEKGYVGLDGTSLTVTEVDDAAGYFCVMMVAYTQDKVIMAQKNVGDIVNIEVDMIAKYLEKQVAAHLTGLQREGGVLQDMVSKSIDKKLAK